MAKRNERRNREIPVRITWIRYEIVQAKGRRLRVLIYARYSTDEQNPLSIEDQVAYCKRFLAALGITEVEIIVLCDEGISGEKVFRAGIDQVRIGVETRQWDLIVVEDSSRLFRNASACMEFVGCAVDKGIRVFCINDEIDTMDEELWEDRLYEAARHHERSNRFTSRRIKRAHEGLWAKGAAIGMLKPGYRRLASCSATNGEPDEGPYFDEIDPDKAPIITAVYERIAGLEVPWSVAHWLTQIQFPKAPNAQSNEWSDRNVVTLIQRTDYRGWQEFRGTLSKKVRATGERRATKNAPDQILTRAMPELRIVPDWLWDAANQAIKNRRRDGDFAHGDEHPLAGIRLNSRGPLSKVFSCGRCGAKMYAVGRNEGGYRCSQSKKGGCWSKATALRELTHRAIGAAIIDRLRSLAGGVDHLASQAAALLSDEGRREARCAELRKREKELEVSICSMNDAIEKANESPESLVKRVSEREAELAEVRGELEGLMAEDKCFEPPTTGEIESRIGQLCAQLEAMDANVGDELQLLVGQIRAVPCQQFDSDKVVLRASFELRLAALLPARTRAVLAGLFSEPVHEQFARLELIVDLFETSTGPKYGAAALALKEQQKLGLTAIGKALKITKRQANIAVQYGEKLREAGRTDPFTELTEPPAAASRWRTGRTKPKE